jgi:hypothetical protein
VSNHSNCFAEIAEENDSQFLPLPVIPAGKEEQILSNYEVEPSTKNEVMYCWRSAITYSFNFLITLLLHYLTVLYCTVMFLH